MAKQAILDRFPVAEATPDKTNIAVTYFLPDNKKTGGRYTTVSGNVKRLDGVEHLMLLSNGTQIPIEDIGYIDGKLFRLFEI